MPESPAAPPRLALGHGQAVWLLCQLRCGWQPEPTQLDNWLKFLRRAGLPFAPAELGTGTGHNLTYRYPQLMELALALVLKGGGLLDSQLVQLIQDSRDELRAYFEAAWRERASHRGRPITVAAGDQEHPLRVQGLFLQLWVAADNLPGAVLWQPMLLEPWQALVEYATPDPQVHLRPPLPLSALAEDVVRLAAAAPAVRRGRPGGA